MITFDILYAALFSVMGLGALVVALTQVFKKLVGNAEWYKKAMDNPMILNNPTIFGAMGGKLLAGGEAGSEMVIGTNTLMETIRQAVAGLVSGDTNINYGGVTVNVYSQPGQDISDLADEIEERINENAFRRRAGFA